MTSGDTMIGRVAFLAWISHPCNWNPYDISRTVAWRFIGLFINALADLDHSLWVNLENHGPWAPVRDFR